MVENVRIAVIDDQENILESFKQILGIKNYEVNVYEKAVDFLEKFSKDKYDLVFLDLWLQKDALPYGRATKDGGIEVLKKIKEMDPDTEVVIVTGYATERTSLNAISLGAMEYLSKPFVIENIYELVSRAIRKRIAKKSKGNGPETGPGQIH